MTSAPGRTPTAFSAAWIATVPVFTHCAYFTVCVFANFLANEEACLPGKGWPPHFELVSTSLRAAISSLAPIGHCVKGVFRKGFPPVIASFPTCLSPPVEDCGATQPVVLPSV